MSSAAKRKRKKRSQAPVALVYVVTVLIFTALLSMFSIYLLKMYHIIGDDKEEEPVVSVQTFNDLFARVNSKGALADAVLIRIDPSNNSVLIVPIPAMTVSSTDNSTIREAYAHAGMAGVKTAVESTLGLKVDNYATLSNEAFERICNIYGGMTYMSAEELYFLSETNDENDISIAKGELATLSGRQMRLLTQYPVFSNGKQGNNQFLGEAMEALVNNMFLQYETTQDNLDNLYQIITTNSDTDMNTDDFKLQKSYLKDMLTGGITPVDLMVPDGTWSEKEDSFVITEDFVQRLKEKAAETTPELETGTPTEKQPAETQAQPAETQAQPAETQAQPAEAAQEKAAE